MGVPAHNKVLKFLLLFVVKFNTGDFKNLAAVNVYKTSDIRAVNKRDMSTVLPFYVYLSLIKIKEPQ